ncbi:major histocompatibility complex class I-related gene protein-like [Notechis scutatus]|uniref:Major histocompatibility complex class I-related gene protein-like n=1 Tax=Notechis scutatus TaxID=8663 RepID=A0A6J1VQY8_9SAUR|nr:major histocompatibility complex class I-related gene protein-like [Notechis scutatus]
MGQLQWRLCLMGAATFLLGNAFGTPSSSHSLLYFHHALLLEGQPQFIEVTYLDGQPIQHYDSNTKRMRPFPLWNNQLDDTYYQFESANMKVFERHFPGKLKKISVSQKNNQNNDHTLQCIQGCKLTADGNEISIHQDAFDGKRMKKTFHRERFYLNGNCIQWLKRYLGLKPQKKELPMVKVTHQEVIIDNLQALTCQAYGFYPKEISASWRKDGEIFNQTNSSVLIVPNSDGTFNARLSIQINPKERNLYRCHVEHVSSSEPLDFVLQITGPSAKVTTHVLNVNETLLNCSICNFYPEDIDTSWMKDGENWDQETFRGDIIRNWDGTYCTWISIDINPMEEYRYRCYVEHEGLQEALSVKAPIAIISTEENFQPLLIICCVVSVLGILILLSIILGIRWCKKRRRDCRSAAKSDPNSSLDNAEKYPLKEREGVPPLNNIAGEESRGDSPTSQDTEEKKQPSENHQISI